jgi:mono/diheme cytochrome c family protein
MTRRLAWTLLMMGGALVLWCGCRNRQESAALESGGRAYLAQCAVCHGTEGKGDGPLAASIASEGKHPPAVLDAARVTALGRDGVRSAIEASDHRRAGSPMPIWGPHLGPDWMDRIADFVVAAPAAGEAGRSAVARYLAAPSGTPPAGRRVYVTYCSGCHGPQGGGDGFVSPEVAAKLAVEPLRGSALARFDDAQLAHLIGAGGAHAPEAETMPGWLHTLSPDDRKALLGYLRTLPGTRQPD